MTADPRAYVTEIAAIGRPVAELQVLHLPMREPEPVPEIEAEL